LTFKIPVLFLSGMTKINRDEGLSIIAHEIKNSLAGIVMGLELIEKNFGKDALITSLIKEAQRLFELSRDSITLSRPLELELLPADIRSLVNECISIQDKVAKENDVKLINKIPERFPPILCDREKLKSAFINLIKNGIHHANKQGWVEIGGKNLGNNMVEIYVYNSDGYIDLKEPKNVFKKFYTGRKGGIGLGLSVVHKIVYEHFGVIDIESRKGYGTKFIITMPTDFHFVDRRRYSERRSGRDRRTRRKV